MVPSLKDKTGINIPNSVKVMPTVLPVSSSPVAESPQKSSKPDSPFTPSLKTPSKMVIPVVTITEPVQESDENDVRQSIASPVGAQACDDLIVSNDKPEDFTFASSTPVKPIVSKFVEQTPASNYDDSSNEMEDEGNADEEGLKLNAPYAQQKQQQPVEQDLSESDVEDDVNTTQVSDEPVVVVNHKLSLASAQTETTDATEASAVTSNLRYSVASSDALARDGDESDESQSDTEDNGSRNGEVSQTGVFSTFSNLATSFTSFLIPSKQQPEPPKEKPKVKAIAEAERVKFQETLKKEERKRKLVELQQAKERQEAEAKSEKKQKREETELKSKEASKLVSHFASCVFFFFLFFSECTKREQIFHFDDHTQKKKKKFQHNQFLFLTRFCFELEGKGRRKGQRRRTQAKRARGTIATCPRKATPVSDRYCIFFPLCHICDIRRVYMFSQI
jgi:hypothetical protein